MAHLRSARNVSNLQVGSLRYDRADVPPYGGVLSVEPTGKVTITDEIRLRNLNVIDSIAVGTTLQVNGALTAGSADIYGTLTVAGDASVDGMLTVAQNALFLNDVSINGIIQVNGEIDISGSLTVAQDATFLSDISVNGNIAVGNNLNVGNDLTAFRVRATYIDSSGIIYGDDVDLSGNLQVDGWSELVGEVTMYNGLQVTGGGTTLSNSLYAGGLATFAAGTSVIGNETVSANLLVGGSIGIGTATPNTRLEIYDSTNPKIYLSGVGGVTGFLSRGTIGVDIGNEGSAVPVRFMPGNTERVRIDESGNMGIGTTTPATVVQVVNPTQTALTGLAIRSGNVNTTIGNYTGPYSAASNYGSIQTTNNGGVTTIGTQPYPLILQPLGGRVCIGGAEYNAIPSSEKFQVADNILVRTGLGITTGAGYSTSYITFNNANAGATTNQQTLTVSMNASGDAILNAAATGTATTPNLVFQTGGTERARVTDSGFTVAGVSEGIHLHATGGATTAYIGDQGAYLSWNNDGFSGQTYLIDQRGIGDGGYRFQIYDNSGNFIKEPLTITNTANVSKTIITQTDVTAGTTTTDTAALTVQNASGGAHRIELYTNMVGGDYNGLTQAGDKGIIFSNGVVNTGNLVIGPSRNGGVAAGIRIDSSGNVGIGKSVPITELDVSGRINITYPANGALTLSNSGTIGAFDASGIYRDFVWPRYSDNATYLNYGTGGFYIRNQANFPTMFLTNAGNVGIGTTTPGYTLDVSGTINSTYVRTPDVGITYLSRVNTSLQSLLPIAYVNSPGGSFVLFNLQSSFTEFPTGQIFGGTVVYITLAPQTKLTVYQNVTNITDSYTNDTNSWGSGFVSDPGSHMTGGIWDSYKLESLI